MHGVSERLVPHHCHFPCYMMMPDEVVPAGLLLIFVLVFARLCSHNCPYPCISNPSWNWSSLKREEGPLLVILELVGQRGACLISKLDHFTDRFPRAASQTVGRAVHRGTEQDHRARWRWEEYLEPSLSVSFLYYSYRYYSPMNHLCSQQDKDNNESERMTAWGEEWEHK